ncbi:MAG: hypothetical protein R2867_02225 [Caldilineaceae bacterium]
MTQNSDQGAYEQLSEIDQEIEDIYASLCCPRPVLVVISGPSGVAKMPR